MLQENYIKSNRFIHRFAIVCYYSNMIDRSRLTAEEETKILALIVRGDTYSEIQKIMEKEHRHVTQVTITKVKQRNKKNLEIIKARMQAKAETDAMALKDKANKILDKKLDRSEATEDILAKAQADYLDKKIEFKEYMEIIRTQREVSITELVSVSKEMHNQSKEDEATPVDKKDITALVQAIKSGDEVTLNQLIFNSGNNNDQSVPSQE
jgi:hypothetical protein